MIRTVFVSVSLILLGASVARADDRHTFIMPENDGYGVGECLAAGPRSPCGRVVADAWCESKGFAKAKSFGRGDDSDVTGSVRSTVNPAPRQPAMVVITCSE